MIDSSSDFGDRRLVSVRVDFGSGMRCECRRLRGGAGACFFRTEVEGEDFRRMEAEGDGGSGVFPAASLSNTDSGSES